MNPKNLSLLLLCNLFYFFVSGESAPPVDTCTTNDDCQSAIFIGDVISDVDYTCIDGCNMYASPDTLIQSCQMGDFPTVWYVFQSDDKARVMNIQVNSTEFDMPIISVFKQGGNCNNLEQLFLTNSNLTCILGSDGQAKAIGTPIVPGQIYLIAISSFMSIGGKFKLCVSTLSTGSGCVVDRNIQVTARSNGGPLEGPFDPAETVSVCMNVLSYTAAGNGCQWFQGIVPVFGNGWDNASFDSVGQPVNATVNDNLMGMPNNGLYGTSTWAWFDSVDYHYNHSSLQVGDFDGNGRVDMCNSVYEADCPNLGGVTGGCCGPCWGSPMGTLLPSGWFAYGINGTCPTTGPPIGVDWGDGNTCGGGMGPWSFCFDLKTRDVPDCMTDSTRRDLSLGFFTFADGETGSWTGAASVCAYDHPVRLSLQAKCGRISIQDPEILPPLCSNDTLRFQVEDPGVNYWEWNISPFSAVPYLPNTAANGFTIQAPLVNATGLPIDVTGVLIGHLKNSNDVILRKIKFKLYPEGSNCEFVGIESPGGTDYDENAVRIFPMPVQEEFNMEWSFVLHHEASLDIYNSQGILMDKNSIPADGSYRHSFSTHAFLPGVYYIHFGNTDFHVVKKIVKL